MNKEQNQSFNKLGIDPEQSRTGQNLLPRPPIVVVMGHIDHGKTTLLSYIRKAKMPKEPGEITQSIGAYEIGHTPTQINADKNADLRGKKITFIDTPGHEAFSKMRQRGAKVADLGILVVAADESVKPQTKEAIEILQESKTLFIVAINKIDKPNADTEKTKQDLMQAGVLLEGFGGNISWQAISAKTGQGINELLDLILLAAELEQLTYNPEAKASGVIIESKMDSRRGLTAAAIVKNGILRMGDKIVTPSAMGKIKILENFLGERVNELLPSSPALILGFKILPQIGEEFFSGKTDLWELQPLQKEEAGVERTPPSRSSGGLYPPKPAMAGEGGQPVLSDRQAEQKVNFILKADVSGSLEALSEIISSYGGSAVGRKTLPNVKIISESVGDITDGDVKSALNTNAIIIGFKTRVNKAAENLAKARDVKIITSEIIYELIKNLEEEIENLKGPEINGQLEILAVFDKRAGKRRVIGGRVISGSFKNNLIVDIQKEEKIIGQGKIINLQKQKQDVGQVNEGEECGILLESDILVNIGDKLIY